MFPPTLHKNADLFLPAVWGLLLLALGGKVSTTLNKNHNEQAIRFKKLNKSSEVLYQRIPWTDLCLNILNWDYKNEDTPRYLPHIRINFRSSKVTIKTCRVQPWQINAEQHQCHLMCRFQLPRQRQRGQRNLRSLQLTGESTVSFRTRALKATPVWSPEVSEEWLRFW